MAWNRKRALAIASAGGAGIALLVAVMIPNTTPVKAPSPLSGLSQQAEAQKPTFSPVAADAVPAGVGSLLDPGALTGPTQVATIGTPVPQPRQDAPAPAVIEAPTVQDDGPSQQQDAPADIAPPPPPVVTARAAPPTDDYARRRAQWRSAMDHYMQGSSQAEQPGG